MSGLIGKKQLEAMAMACCYAEFHGDYEKTPLAYWRNVKPDQRKFYYARAEALIHLCRDMPTVQP